MRIFLDANIIMEYFGKRKYYDLVSHILKNAYQGNFDVCLSSSIVDNVIYLLGSQLKAEGIHEPEKRNRIRQMLVRLLSYVDVVDMNRRFILQALRDEEFKDLEDGLQYYCALENKCDALVTINTKDFPSSSSFIEILDPKQFVDKYIED